MVLKLNRTATEITRAQRNLINENWENLEYTGNSLQNQLNDLVISDGTSVAEVVQARGGEATLNDRINDIDRTIITVNRDLLTIEEEKADKTELSQINRDVLARVIRNEPESITFSMFDQSAREQITGGNTAVVGPDSVSTINVVNKSLGEDKISFINRGKNLFNKDALTRGFVVSPIDGTLSPSGAGNSASEFIRITPNTNYIKKTLGTAYQVVFYRSDRSFLSSIQNETLTFTTPPNSGWLRFNVSPSIIDVQQLEEGTVSTEYEPFKYEFNERVDFNGSPLEVEDLSYSVVSQRLTNLLDNTLFSQGLLNWIVNGASNTLNGNIINVTANTANGRLIKNREIPGNVGDLIYYAATVSATTDRVGLSNGTGILPIEPNSPVFARHSGSGQFERLSAIVANNGSLFLGVVDRRESGWNSFGAQYMVAVNLTEIFGAGNEPNKEEMDIFMSGYRNSWFEKSSNRAIGELELMKFRTLNLLPNTEIGIRISLNENTSLVEHLGNYNIEEMYPFNSIKLCNIQKTPWGATKVTYSNEPGFTRDGSNGDVMVEIPKHYFKRYVENGYEYIYISGKLIEGYSIDPAFVEDGKELDVIYVSAYEGVMQGDNLRSLSGQQASTGLNINQYRQYARNNGEGYGLLDGRTLFMLQRLFMINRGDRNSQINVGNGLVTLPWQNWEECLAIESATASNTIITNGLNAPRFFRVGMLVAVVVTGEYFQIEQRRLLSIQGQDTNRMTLTFDGPPVDIVAYRTRIYTQAQETGLTDNVEGVTGMASALGGFNGTEAVKFLNMENLWGNAWHLVDGVFTYNLITYVAQNMRDSSDDVNAMLASHKPLAYRLPLQDTNEQNQFEENNYFVKNMLFDKLNSNVALPIELGNGSNRYNGYGDPFYTFDTADTAYFAAHGGGVDHIYRAGLFTWRFWYTMESTAPILNGARIIYKPI